MKYASILLTGWLFLGQSGTKINKIMEQRLSFITIGAKNLDELKRFYTDKFNWTPLKEDGGIVFFKMNGFILGLYPTIELAADAKVSMNTPGFKGFTLSINYDSEKKVDEVFSTLGKRGVRITKPPQKASWGGYSGYVEDIEGNLWEFAYNPFLVMDTDGNVLSQH
jgi:catechol 2,3-dioxygenase-like lactoylglutathione lyase family enzyme